MNLVINSASVFKGGAEQVALSFMHECRRFTENEYHVILAPNLALQIDQSEFPENFTFHILDKRPASSLSYFLKMMKWYRKFEKVVKPDCVISTGGHGYWRPKVPLAGGFNIPHFVYPESPYFINLTKKKKAYWRAMRLIHMYFYSRLDAILVQTEDVKERLAEIISREIPTYVISNTVNSYFISNPVFENKLPDKKLGEIRLLTLSSYYPHKNLDIIKKVVRILVDNGEFKFRFIVTLPDEIFKKVFGEEASRLIYNVGPVAIKECPSLYRECDFMFLPTLLECFSASYAEAMMMEKPIITSDFPFARTVCKDAAVYFDPLDPLEIANKIVELGKNPEKQSTLVRKGNSIVTEFSTSLDRAKKYLDICKELSTEIH